MLFANRDCYLWSELISFLAFYACNGIVNTEANSMKILFYCNVQRKVLRWENLSHDLVT